MVHNVELKPGKGAQMARSAGSSVQILDMKANILLLRLRSGEVRKVLELVVQLSAKLEIRITS